MISQIPSMCVDDIKPDWYYYSQIKRGQFLACAKDTKNYKRVFLHRASWYKWPIGMTSCLSKKPVLFILEEVGDTCEKETPNEKTINTWNWVRWNVRDGNSMRDMCTQTRPLSPMGYLMTRCWFHGSGSQPCPSHSIFNSPNLGKTTLLASLSASNFFPLGTWKKVRCRKVEARDLIVVMTC